MNKQTQRFMAQADYPPPLGVKRMVVRRTQRTTCGPYTVTMESSCGAERPRIAGSVCIRLYDRRTLEPDKAVAVKRFAVDNWREADDEVRRLVAYLCEG